MKRSLGNINIHTDSKTKYAEIDEAVMSRMNFLKATAAATIPAITGGMGLARNAYGQSNWLYGEYYYTHQSGKNTASAVAALLLKSNSSGDVHVHYHSHHHTVLGEIGQWNLDCPCYLG